MTLVGLPAASGLVHQGFLLHNSGGKLLGLTPVGPPRAQALYAPEDNAASQQQQNYKLSRHTQIMPLLLWLCLPQMAYLALSWL